MIFPENFPEASTKAVFYYTFKRMLLKQANICSPIDFAFTLPQRKTNSSKT